MFVESYQNTVHPTVVALMVGGITSLNDRTLNSESFHWQDILDL